MTDHITALAGTLVALARSGGTKLVNGTTVGAPASGVVQVDLGAGRMVPATVPGSSRANIVDGQKIKLLKNQTNNTYTVESVLTALTTPTVPAAPTDASNVTGSGASASWTQAYYYRANVTDIAEVSEELTKIETALNNVIQAVGELLTAHNTTASAVSGVVTGVNSVVGKVNSINTTTAALRSALLGQGHIS